MPTRSPQSSCDQQPSDPPVEVEECEQFADVEVETNQAPTLPLTVPAKEPLALRRLRPHNKQGLCEQYY